MDAAVRFTLTFDGALAAQNKLDFYDASQAVVGFQRTLALTAHLVINGEIITQAPALKNARVIVQPPEEGSWKIAAIVMAGVYSVATAPKETPVGHLLYSAYDYLVSENLGFHVDYDKPLGQSLNEIRESNPSLNPPEQNKLDALSEKCEGALIGMHRPIVQSRTAERASIASSMGTFEDIIAGPLTETTYDYIKEKIEADESEVVEGFVSSYNANTFRGRFFDPAQQRPISFEMNEKIRTQLRIELLVNSLAANATHDKDRDFGRIFFRVRRITSKQGSLKSYVVYEISRSVENLN